MIENDRYYRRYVKDVKSGYIFGSTLNLVDGLP